MTLLTLLPAFSYAQYAAGWTATSTNSSFITPNKINGIFQGLRITSLMSTTTATSSFTGGLFGSLLSAPFFHATSTTATSTLSGGLQVDKGIKFSILNSSNCDIKSDTNGFLYCGTDATGGGGTAISPFASTSNNANSAYFLGTGSVGIGSSTPDAKLSITGTNSASTTLYTVGANSQTAPIANFLITTGSATSSVLLINSNGNIGLGTTTPGSQLSGGDTGANTFNISATATSTFGSGLNIRTGCFAINGTCVGGGGGSLSGGTADMLASWVNSTSLTATGTPTATAYFATSTNATSTFLGNVMIGNSLFSGRLAVNGFGTTAKLQASYNVNDIAGINFGNINAGSLSATCLFMDNDRSTDTITGSYYGGVCFGGSNYALPGFDALKPNGIGIFAKDGDLSLGSASIDAASSSIRFFAGGGFGAQNQDAVMTRVVSSGLANFGLATTSPFARLSIAGDSLGTAPIVAVSTSTASATSTAFIIDRNGFVGINTKTPLASLNVNGEVILTDLNAGTGKKNLSIKNLDGNLYISSSTDLGASTTPALFSIVQTSTSASSTITNDLSVQGQTDLAYATMGNFNFDPDGGIGGGINFPIINSAAGTVNSFPIGFNTTNATTSAMVFKAVSTGNGNFNDFAIGIGSSTPWAKLSILGLPFENPQPAFVIASSTLVATSTNFMINFDGTTGIGTTSPFAKLSIAGVSLATQPLFAVSTSTASATNTPFMIDGSGNLFVQGMTLSTSGNAVCRLTTGQLVDAGGTACNTSSRRFKTNIKLLDNGLDIVMNMIPRSFTRKAPSPSQPSGKEVGFIAEEVAKIDSRLVEYEVDGKTPRGVNYAEYTAILTKAIQEQQAQISTLQSMVDEQQTDISKLQLQVKQLTKTKWTPK